MAKLDQFLRQMRKDCGTTTAAESELTKITDWYDTGSLALNRVISGGDSYKGIPKGKVVTRYGDSQSGKSLIASQTAANALKNNKIDVIYYVDSEGGGTGILENLGVDMNRVEYIPVHAVEKCAVQLLKLYDSFIKMHEEYIADPDNNDDIRAIVILDSLGNLKADKLINDAVNKDVQVQDMGLSQKLANSMLAGLTMRVQESGVTLLVITHTYDQTNSMFPSKIKPLPGGKKVEYASHVIVQTTKLLIKASNDDFLTGKETEKTNAFFKGNRLNFFCWKNRCGKPGYDANVYLDFDTGFSKYDGLIESAVELGFLEEVRGGYSCPTYENGKKISYREIVANDDIWNTFIDKFNEQSIKKLSYSTSVDEELEKINEEIDEN